MTKVTIGYSYSEVRKPPPDFVPTEPPPPPKLVTQAAAFPWDLPYVWEQQKDLGWPAEIAEADDPLAELTRILTRYGGSYDPLALVPDEDREYWHAVLNSVLRRPGGFVWPSDYVTVGNFVWAHSADPTNTDWWKHRVFAELLQDAKTLEAMGRRYGVYYVGMPAEEKRQAGRPSEQHYDWAFRITQSGQLSDEQAFVMVLAMRGIDPEALPQAERQKRRNAFDSAMKRRKGQKI